MNVHEQVFEHLFSVLLRYIPRARTAGSYAYSLLNLSTWQAVSKGAAPFYISKAVYEGSNFSVSS